MRNDAMHCDWRMIVLIRTHSEIWENSWLGHVCHTNLWIYWIGTFLEIRIGHRRCKWCTQSWAGKRASPRSMPQAFTKSCARQTHLESLISRYDTHEIDFLREKYFSFKLNQFSVLKFNLIFRSSILWHDNDLMIISEIIMIISAIFEDCWKSFQNRWKLFLREELWHWIPSYFFLLCRFLKLQKMCADFSKEQLSGERF